MREKQTPWTQPEITSQPQFSGKQAAAETIDRIEKALTDPSVLNNPSSFAERASSRRS